jgi:hypothetical protein
MSELIFVTHGKIVWCWWKKKLMICDEELECLEGNFVDF